MTAKSGQDGPDGSVSGSDADSDSRNAGEEDGGRDQYGMHVVSPFSDAGSRYSGCRPGSALTMIQFACGVNVTEGHELQ
jgi:hypothetical protein